MDGRIRKLTTDEFALAAALAAYQEQSRNLAAQHLDLSNWADAAPSAPGLAVHLEACPERGCTTVRKLGPELFLCTEAGAGALVRARESRPGELAVRTSKSGEVRFRYTTDSSHMYLSHRGESWSTRLKSGPAVVEDDPHAAPTGGIVRRLLVETGREVEAGTPLYVLETMKMEAQVSAACDGLVAALEKEEGATVEKGQTVVVLEPAAGPRCKGANRVTETDGEGPETGRSQWVSTVQSPLETLLNYLLGYDLEIDDAVAVFELLDKEARVELLVQALKTVLLFEQAASDKHLHFVVHFLRQNGQTPTARGTAELLGQAALLYGYGSLDRFCSGIEPVYRLITALRQMDERRECIAELLARTQAWGSELAGLVAEWYRALSPLFCTKQRGRILSLMSRQDTRTYYLLAAPPVAEEYWAEWKEHCDQRSLELPPLARQEFDISELPIGEWLPEWMNGFRFAPMATTRLDGLDVYLVEALPPDGPSRLVAVARVHDFVPEFPVVRLPELERAAIECYKLVGRAENRAYEPNHVFVVLDEETVIPWTGDGLSLDVCRRIAARVAGFARGMRIDATEVILNLGEGHRLLEIRHAPEVGAISRLPCLLSERRREDDPERWLDSRQQRLGKLLNRDRARLLYDNGEFETIRVQGIEDETLDVYVGLISGKRVLVYANDFRKKGGAVGQKEGKKLTLATLYGYFTGCPVIAIHDGAGANVKESIVSLAWAGAYFGALAVTGGLSGPDEFGYWWDNHQLKDELQESLRAMGVTDFCCGRPVRHIHLHLGASAGLLVYGPSISSLSLMVDHPNVYRVLTGSKAVEQTTGEKLSNYLLGGARVHGEVSGDVDLVFESEEQVLGHARTIVTALQPDRAVCLPDSVGVSNLEIMEAAACAIELEAVRQVLDREFFFELKKGLRGAQSVVAVLSKLGGTPIVSACLPTRTGITNRAAWKKLYQALKTAIDFDLPFVLAAASDPYLWQVRSAQAVYQMQEFSRLLASARIPKAAVLLSDEAAHSPLFVHFDFSVLVNGRGEPGAVPAYLCARMADSFSAAWKDVAGFLRFMQLGSGSSAKSNAPYDEPSGPARLPSRLSQPYDVRQFLDSIVDKGSFFEVWPSDQLPLVCGLATVCGSPVAVLADDPARDSGAQTMEAVTKFTRFNRMAERLRIPIVQFNDSPAFMPGSVQERRGIQGAGGVSLLEETLTRLPRLSVTLRQNYGGRLVHANLVTLGPPRTGIAWTGARMGVMGEQGAAAVLLARKRRTETVTDEFEERWKREYVDNFLSPELAVRSGVVRELVGLSRIRHEIHRWLNDFLLDTQVRKTRIAQRSG